MLSLIAYSLLTFKDKDASDLLPVIGIEFLLELLIVGIIADTIGKCQ